MANVLILTNLPAPYRLPVFEIINNSHQLTVKFCQSSDPSRQWSAELDKYTFRHDFLDLSSLPHQQITHDIRSVLRDGKIDVCIFGESAKFSLALIYLLRIAKKENIPTILWTEGVDVSQSGPMSKRGVLINAAHKAYDNIVRRYMYALADEFIAYSGQMTERFLMSRGVDQDCIVTGTQVMPRSLLGPRNGERNQPRPFTVLYLGYLREQKGVEVLINAYQKLETLNTELVIAGDGPDSERLHGLAPNSDDINFTGFVTGEAKWDLYRGADLFVLPTFLDTWGLVVNEALYYRTPVITTEAAGASQIVIKNDAGKVIPPRDTNELTKAMEEIISSPELQARYEQNASNCDIAWDPVVGACPFLKAIDRVS